MYCVGTSLPSGCNDQSTARRDSASNAFGYTWPEEGGPRSRSRSAPLLSLGVETPDGGEQYKFAAQNCSKLGVLVGRVGTSHTCQLKLVTHNGSAYPCSNLSPRPKHQEPHDAASVTGSRNRARPLTTVWRPSPAQHHHQSCGAPKHIRERSRLNHPFREYQEAHACPRPASAVLTAGGPAQAQAHHHR